MALNRADVELLDRNLQELTETGLKRRGLNIAQQRADQEQQAEANQALLRQKILEAETRRTEIEQNKADLEKEGKSTVYLKGPNGGTVEYTGPKSGLQAWLDQGTQIVDKPQDKPPAKFGRYEWTDPHGGKAVIDLNTQDDLANVQKLAQSSGIAPHQPPSTASAVQLDTAATALENQAGDLENQAGQIDTSQDSGVPGETTPAAAKKAALTSQASGLRERAKALRSAIGPKSPTVWETQTVTPQGIGQPDKVTRSVRGPVGSLAPILSTPAPTGGAPQTAPPADQRTTGSVYQTPKGPLKWTGTGWVTP